MESRDIKYNAWDTVNKVMTYNVHRLDSFNEYISKDKYIVLQFTGLKDKNGTEIYEGDIIKWKETRFHTKEQEEKGVAMPRFLTSEVVWEEGGFIVGENKDYDTPLCCFFGENMSNKFDFKAEIISNIYE